MAEIEVVAFNESSRRAASNIDWLSLLDKQIARHHKFEQSQTILSSAVLEASRVAWSEDEDALARMVLLKQRLEEERRRGDAAAARTLESEIPDAIRGDQNALRKTAEIEGLGCNFLQSATLFFPGRFGRLATVATYSMGQAKLADSLPTSLVDGSLGALKGGILHAGFSKLGSLEIGIPAKGLAIGTSSRVVEMALSRNTFLDLESGKFNATGGVSKVIDAALDPAAIGTDIVVFGLSHAMTRTASSLSRGALDNSPLLSNCLTANSFGMSIGASGEFQRQREWGEKLDVAMILRRGLLQGGLDTIAALPGGFKTDSRLKSMTTGFVSEQLSGAKHSGSQRLTRLVEFLSLAGGPKLAFAGLPSEVSVTKGLSSPLLSMIEGESSFATQPGVRQIEAGRAPQDRTVQVPAEKGGALSNNEQTFVSRVEVLDNLDLPAVEHCGIERLGERISSVTESERRFWRQKDAVRGPFVDFEDFSNRALVLDRNPSPVVVYKFDGHPTEIIVEKAYDEQLDAVRSFRTMKERGWSGSPVAAMRDLGLAPEMASRALPEDFSPMLERLPSSDLIKAIVLSNERNVEDLYNLQKYGEHSFRSSASVTRGGDVTFFQRDLDLLLGRDLSHEWAHLLKYRCPEIGKLFDIASNYEADGRSYPTRVARIDPEEDWATSLGEEFLHPSAERFRQYVNAAPLGSMILARALSTVIDPVPSTNRTAYQKVLAERILVAEQLARPAAEEKVAALLSGFSPRHGEELASNLRL